MTTDVAYHEWHLAFDKVLRDLEQSRLLPTLTTLVSGLLDAAAAQRAELAGTPLADDARGSSSCTRSPPSSSGWTSRPGRSPSRRSP